MTLPVSARKQLPILLLLLLYMLVCTLGVFVLSGISTHGSFVILSMWETALILFVVPLLAVNRMDTVIRRNTMAQWMPGGGNSRLILALLGHPLLIAVVVCLIPVLSGLMGKQAFGSVPASFVIRSFFLAVAIGLFALAVGFYAATVCKNAISAAGLALLILMLICTEPIWFGPIINSFPNTNVLIQSSLMINPFVSVAAALNFDILRTDPFYQICPIGQLNFTYPSFWAAMLFNLIFALLIFYRSLAGIRRISAPSI